MKAALWISIAVNCLLLLFIAKRFYYSRVPPVLWTYDIAMLGDSHVARVSWNDLLDCRVANFGKRSATVKQIYDMVPGVINCKPAVCFIHGGTNDIVNGVPVDTTIWYYNKIVFELKRAGIRPVIIRVMKLKYPEYDNPVDELNNKLDSLAPVIDVGVVPDDLQTDGIHMEGSGYAKWAEAIRRIIGQ